MPSAANVVKVLYKGKDETFYVFVDSVDAHRFWKDHSWDAAQPLTRVLSGPKNIFVSPHGQGNQGAPQSASNAVLENQFGTSDWETIARIILADGTLQSKSGPERTGMPRRFSQSTSRT